MAFFTCMFVALPLSLSRGCPAGGDVRGNVRERELRYLPPGAVCVGETDATFEEMRGFVDDYPDRLSLVSNSCVSFCDAFLSHHRTVNMGGK